MKAPTCLVLLPHHLGEPRIKGLRTVLLRPCDQELKIHKLRIAFTEACMRASGVPIVDAVPAGAWMYDPLDSEARDRYAQHVTRFLPLRTSFLLSQEEVDLLVADFSSHKVIQHRLFFERAKKLRDILTHQPSTDADNRARLPRDHTPTVRHAARDRATLKRDVIRWVNERYASHPGTCEALSELPITRASARAHLRHFLDHRLQKYGQYQDAIHGDDAEVYHSHCSFLLNIGLLTAREVLDGVMRYAGKVPMNSLEGFVRQLLGWREYMRFVYHGWGPDLTKAISNDPGRKLSGSWWKGTTGILPIDHEIKKLHDRAWSHHIVRLMVFLNFMKITDVRPRDTYRWFMEMVALDAYPWVMVSNIAVMGHIGQPKFARRPYLSSSAYIRRMSDFKDDGHWCCAWDAAYGSYVSRHRQEPGMAFYTRPRGITAKKASCKKEERNIAI